MNTKQKVNNAVYLLIFTIVVLVLNSCVDKCRYVEPFEICNAQLNFKILNKDGENIFTNEFSIDSLIILNESQDTVNYLVEPDDKIFKFELFDCDEEKDKFNTTIHKKFLLKLSATVTDTISIDFRPISPATECGGSNFEFINIKYYGTDYYIRNYYIYNVNSLNRP